MTPFGELVADPTRGTLMGNRGGRIHDPRTRELLSRRWASRRWICCLTSFKDRHRTVWGTGYTELFFLDEVTALAAGHRPCAECRRAAARTFQRALAAGLGLAEPPSLDEIDRRLHAERLDGRRPRRHQMQAESLPDGAMAVLDGEAIAIRGGLAAPWRPGGYGPARARPGGIVAVLTPPTALAALAGGYRPLWHGGAAALKPLDCSERMG